MFYYTHAHTRFSCQPHIDGIVMSRTCLIRPGPWQGSRSDRDSSIIQEVREPKGLIHIKRNTHTHTVMEEIAVAAGCRVTGVEMEDESGNYSLSFFFSSPLKRNSSLSQPPSLPHLWKHPISTHISFTQFKTHTSFAPSAPPPLSSSISYSQLGHASNLRHYLCWPFI